MSPRAASTAMNGMARWLGRTRHSLVGALCVGAALLAAGCVSLPAGVPPGATRADVVARLGKPTVVYPLPEGERLQYSELPAGTAVYNLDLDKSGRLVRNEQVLTLASLHRIEPDRWTAADVRLLLGTPTQVEHVASFTGDVWTYRFRDINNARFIHVHIDPGGVVRKIQFTDDVRELELGQR